VLNTLAEAQAKLEDLLMFRQKADSPNKTKGRSPNGTVVIVPFIARPE